MIPSVLNIFLSKISAPLKYHTCYHQLEIKYPEKEFGVWACLWACYPLVIMGQPAWYSVQECCLWELGTQILGELL